MQSRRRVHASNRVREEDACVSRASFYREIIMRK